MTTEEVFKKYKNVFGEFDKDNWFRYYAALNAETPVDEVKDRPYFLELSDAEKICYVNALDELKKERKSFPQASYEVQYKDFE